MNHWLKKNKLFFQINPCDDEGESVARLKAHEAFSYVCEEEVAAACIGSKREKGRRLTRKEQVKSALEKAIAEINEADKKTWPIHFGTADGDRAVKKPRSKLTLKDVEPDDIEFIRDCPANTTGSFYNIKAPAYLKDILKANTKTPPAQRRF